MKKSELGPLSPERPELVELNELECCALAHAFAKNEQTIVSLLAVADPKTMKILADGMAKAKRVAFARNEEVALVYPQIAHAELKRLAGTEKTAFRCDHRAAEHKSALESVIKKLSRPVN